MTILLFLLVGIVEFGIIFFQFVQLRDAAQEGALYGSVCDCTVAEIQERAIASSDKPIDLNNAFIQVTATDSLGNPKDPELACEGDALTVRVIYIHKIFMPFMPKLLGRNDIPLNAVVVDTVLRPVCP